MVHNICGILISDENTEFVINCANKSNPKKIKFTIS